MLATATTYRHLLSMLQMLSRLQLEGGVGTKEAERAVSSSAASSQPCYSDILRIGCTAVRLVLYILFYAFYAQQCILFYAFCLMHVTHSNALCFMHFFMHFVLCSSRTAMHFVLRILFFAFWAQQCTLPLVCHEALVIVSSSTTIRGLCRSMHCNPYMGHSCFFMLLLVQWRQLSDSSISPYAAFILWQSFSIQLLHTTAIKHRAFLQVTLRLLLEAPDSSAISCTPLHVMAGLCQYNGHKA